MSPWSAPPPASEGKLATLVAEAPSALPTAYVEHLRESNVGEGELGIEPGWVSIWPAEAVWKQNEAYGIAKNVPGRLGFGSSGGEILAFDVRGTQPWPIVIVPFVPMHPSEIVPIARSFEALRRAFGVSLEESAE